MSAQAPPQDELDELIAFLGDQRPQIKEHAVELVQGLTGSPEGIAQLSTRSATLLPALFRLVGDERASRGALVALVNISQEPTVQQGLLELNACARCMDYIRERTCPHADLLVMLLANLTSLEEGAAALLQLGKGPLEGLHLAMLLKLFLAPAPLPGEDPYQHVATILPNVTRLVEGRRLLLQPGRGLLPALTSQLRSKCELRRQGCAGAIKNCCFSAEQDGTLGDMLQEKEALAEAVHVLCGTGEGGARDGDAAVREALAEAVLCLARTTEGRKKLWELRVPELLQKGYEEEEHGGVCQAMEATAELFLQDGFEPGGTEDAAQGGGADAGGAQEQERPAQQQQQHEYSSRRIVQIEEID